MARVQLTLGNGGSCFLPARMAEPFIASGHRYRVDGSPEYVHPACMVYPREAGGTVLEQALQGLRDLARQQAWRSD
jgi:hypothetical protein